MTAADDARKAIASEAHRRVFGRPSDHHVLCGGHVIEAERTLTVAMPDGRTIAQHLNDGATAERLLHQFAKLDRRGALDSDIDCMRGRYWLSYDPEQGWLPLDTVDPEAAALLARLDADQ